ncbi:hypothetical protein ACQ4M3_09855 [Leptolyngbya sp. AN03gr2]|uniref:hypothetical protein n=1 Tax=Leptolyngbya sp. AN03gr2 TaxID=3423364 RepID=UPI003D32383C
MTPIDFAYWLQGYFELSGSNVQWDHYIQATVSEHIELVKVTPGNYDSRMVQFIGWLESAIEFKAPVSTIRLKLNEIFEHVIDPNTAGNSEQQNQIHHGWGDGARC